MSSPSSSQYAIAGVEASILGELNCNLAAYPQETQAKNLLEIWNLYQYHQAINVATRITKKIRSYYWFTYNQIPKKSIYIPRSVTSVLVTILLYTALKYFAFLNGNQRLWSRNN